MALSSFKEYLSVFRTVINFLNHPVFTGRTRLHLSLNVFVLWPLPGHDWKHTAMHTGSSPPTRLSPKSRRVKLPPTRRLWQYAERPYRIHADGHWTDWPGVFCSVQKLPAGNTLDEKLADRRNARVALDQCLLCNRENAKPPETLVILIKCLRKISCHAKWIK